MKHFILGGLVSVYLPLIAWSQHLFTFETEEGFPAASNQSHTEVVTNDSHRFSSENGFFITTHSSFSQNSKALNIPSNHAVVLTGTAVTNLSSLSFDYFKPSRDDWVNLHIYARVAGDRWREIGFKAISSRPTMHVPDNLTINTTIGAIEALKIEVRGLDGNSQNGLLIDNLNLTNSSSSTAPQFSIGFESAENYPANPFTTLNTQLGTWTASAGHAEIITHSHALTGSQALHLKGGTNHQVTFESTTLASIDQLTINTERWTSAGIFDYTIAVSRDGNQWQTVYQDQNDQTDNGSASSATPVGSYGTQNLDLTAYNPNRLRFTLSSSGGALLDDLIIAGPLADNLTPLQITASMGEQTISKFAANQTLATLNFQILDHTQSPMLEKLTITTEDPEQLLEMLHFRTTRNSRYETTLLGTANGSSVYEIMLNERLLPGLHSYTIDGWLKADKTVNTQLSINSIEATISGADYPIALPKTTYTLADIPYRQDLAVPGMYGSKNYRIPGLATTNEGTLLAVYDIRYDNNNDIPAHVDVGLRRSTDNGRSWSEMQVIMDMGDSWVDQVADSVGNGIGDPAILVDRYTNTIYVAAVWTCGYENAFRGTDGTGFEPNETAQFILVKSEDDGLTWSEPINITKQVKEENWHMVFQGPGKGICMQDGTLVFPAQFINNARRPMSTIIYSHDRGETWQIGTGAKDNTTEAQVVELDDGTLMLNMRTNGSDYRSVATTTDFGQTWTEHSSSAGLGNLLADPVCQGSIERFQDQSILLFTNPNNTNARYDLSVKVSTDNGQSWPHVRLINDEFTAYSCLTILEDNSIACFYEPGTSVVVERFSLEWATNGAITTPPVNHGLSFTLPNQLLLKDEQITLTLDDLVVQRNNQPLTDLSGYELVLLNNWAFTASGTTAILRDSQNSDPQLILSVRLISPTGEIATVNQSIPNPNSPLSNTFTPTEGFQTNPTLLVQEVTSNNQINWQSERGFYITTHANFNAGSEAMQIPSGHSVTLHNAFHYGVGSVTLDYYKPARDDWVNLILYGKTNNGRWEEVGFQRMTSRPTAHTPGNITFNVMRPDFTALKIEAQQMDGLPGEGFLIDNLEITTHTNFLTPFTETMEGTPFVSGAFTQIQSAGNRWLAPDSHAEVNTANAFEGSKCLRIRGGTNQTLTWHVEALQNIQQLSFRAERWTSGGIFDLTVAASTDGTNWENVFVDDTDQSDDGNATSTVPLGRYEQIMIPLNEGSNYQYFQFILSSTAGMLIDNATVYGESTAGSTLTTTATTTNSISIFAENFDLAEFTVNLNSQSPQMPQILEAIQFNYQTSAPFAHTSAQLFTNYNTRYHRTKLGEALLTPANSQLVTLQINEPLQSGSNAFTLNLMHEGVLPLDAQFEISHVTAVINGQEYPINLDQTTFTTVDEPFRTYLAVPGQYGSSNYRIPGLATTNEGTLLAVYDIRYDSSRDVPAHIDVGLRRSTDNGRTWSDMQVIMDTDDLWADVVGDTRGNGIGDPAILVDRQTNTIYVASVWSCGAKNAFLGIDGRGLTPAETAQFVLVKSEDDGQTWSELINITAQIKDPNWHMLFQGPGKGICLYDGTLVFPAQFVDQNRVPHATIIYSADRGETWQIGTGAKPNTTEAQVVELDDGTLMLNMRTNGSDYRSVATTTDFGQTWSEHSSSAGLGNLLADPVCQGSIDRYDNHSLLLFTNPNNPNGRNNLSIRVSTDNGTTWPHVRTITPLGSAYSCLTVLQDHSIGCFYELGSAIVFERFSMTWATSGQLNTPAIDHGLTFDKQQFIGLSADNRSCDLNQLALLRDQQPIADLSNYQIIALPGSDFTITGSTATLKADLPEKTTYQLKIRLKSPQLELVTETLTIYPYDQTLIHETLLNQGLTHLLPSNLELYQAEIDRLTAAGTSLTTRFQQQIIDAINDGLAVERIDLLPGWNLLSAPLDQWNISATMRHFVLDFSLYYFQNNNYQIRYNGGQEDIILNNGTGYWIYLEGHQPASIAVVGEIPRTVHPLPDTQTKWSIHGSTEEKLMETWLNEYPNLDANIWGWDANAGRYHTIDVTIPGQGYWFYQNQP